MLAQIARSGVCDRLILPCPLTVSQCERDVAQERVEDDRGRRGVPRRGPSAVMGCIEK